MTTATALIPFVPSGADFERALAFFADLGFETAWPRHGTAMLRMDGGLAGLKFGAAAFMLQDIDVPEWQRNQMLTLEVDDLEAYWQAIAGKELETRYPAVRTRPPNDFPWGREVHIVDPAGVCWHIRQSRPA